MRKFMILGLAILLTGIVSSNAYAHDLWVSVDNYNPRVNEEITISLEWGHLFPGGGSIEVDRIERMYLISPDGKEIPLEIKAEGEKELVAPVKMKLEKAGTYLVVVEKKSYFATLTTEGYKKQSKKGLKGIIWSYWVESCPAKAIINVGVASSNSFQKENNQRYQAIPLDDPANLKEGDYLHVKVTLDGKPYSTIVYSTYAGFSSENDTFAYTTRTNKDGIAKIRILKPGIWLIKAHDEIPYPDSKETDNYYFTSTLTFEIK